MSNPDKPHDHAPGDQLEEEKGHWLRSANIGLGLSIILTVASFGLARSHLLYAPAVPVALIALAIAQMGVHLAFFLHITTGPDNTNNVLALAFGVMVVFLLVLGSIWIMGHLSATMMPQDAAMQAQMQP